VVAAPAPALAGTSAKHGGSSGKLDPTQVRRAVDALCTHLQRERASGARASKDVLASEEDDVQVVLATKAAPPSVGKATRDKPVRIALPHPIASLDEVELCLICKDPQREYKDKLAAQSVRAKVIGVSKLKKKYVPHEAKRQLCASYDLFVADQRVLPMLPALLGKTFFKKKKLPAVVDLKKRDLRAELEETVGGSFFRHATGVSNSFKVGTTAQPPAHLAANVVAAVEQVVGKTPKGWANVQALHLRATNSVALPFYNSLPHA